MPLASVAQAPDIGVRARDMVVGSVGMGDLQLLLDDMGARYTTSGVNDRQAPYVFATSQDGMSFGIYTACANANGTDCRGLEFLAVFKSDRSIEEVSATDQSYAAVSIYKSAPDTVNVSRYVILDHGVTWANLLENGAVFEALCEKLAEELSEAPTAQVADSAHGGLR
ncbi:MAG: YbjN domain-containing protein [Alphaproteobacteria bacterium]|nr:YbjN domain-containing protein [Alphaproteobacteria bacterium]